jgi:nucleolar complex protein 3
VWFADYFTRNDAVVKKPVVRAPAASVPEPAELTASEDEDSDLDDDNLPPLSSSDDEDEMEDVEDEKEEVFESDEDMEEDDRYVGSDEEQDYELKPRKVSQEWTKKDKFTKLPIKLPGGKWEQAEEEYSDEDEEKEEPVPEIDSELSEIEMEESIETLEPKKKTFLARKEELAQIASTIMEDPESNVSVHAFTGGHSFVRTNAFYYQIALLRTLKAISEDKNPKVAQLALLTQLAVYKDIVPG